MTEEQPGARPSSEEKVFSLEDLDKIIEAEDPNFKEEMEGIKTAGADAQIDIESIDLDAESEGVETSRDENREMSKKEKFVASVHKFISSVKMKSKQFSARAKSIFLSSIANTSMFFRHELPERLKYYRSGFNNFLKLVAQYIKTEYSRFSALKRIEKIGLGFVIFASFFSIFFLSKTYTGAWLPGFSDPMIHSLEERASMVKSYKAKEDLQNLFQAFPETEIYVLLTKVIVNLKPDQNSSRNPMGIYEIYLGLDSKDTAVEVKQREREMLDLIQRALEPFTYSEVSSQVGKVRMKASIRDGVNAVLNQGQAFHVYFNTFITNP